MEQRSNSFLGTEKISNLTGRYAVPCIISLLMAALYNIVDQVFITNADYLGSYGDAANTVIFPLTVAALAIAVMIRDDYCTFISLHLGANEKRNARRSIGNAVILCITAGLILAALYFLFQNPILTLFGGRTNEETFLHSEEYFIYIIMGTPFYMFGQALNPVIRSDGSSGFTMVSTLVGVMTNIILDPVFIFIFRWGVIGAAVATVIGQVLATVLAVQYLCHMKAVTLHRQSFGLHGGLMERFLPLGICSFLSQISLVASMAAINNIIRTYETLDPVFSQSVCAQIPMTVTGVVMRFFQIIISISMDMAVGCIPIVGHNMGTGHRNRAESLFTLLLALETTVGAAALGIVELFPGWFIALFGASNESIYYTEFAVRAFRIYLCMLVLAYVNKATFIYLQSLGKALVPTLLSMVREVVSGVGFALLLPIFSELDGVLYSMSASDMLTFIISAVVIGRTCKTLKQPRGRTMKNRIMTISRELGSGERTIGKMTAETLGIPCHDQELIGKLSENSSFIEDYIREQGGSSVHKGWFASALSGHSLSGVFNQGYLWTIQRSIILELTARESCVIVGRCADYILRDAIGCLKVFIHAGFDKRAQRIVNLYGETDIFTRKGLTDKDKRRTTYCQFYIGTQWGLARNYHVTLDNGVLGIEQCNNLMSGLY